VAALGPGFVDHTGAADYALPLMKIAKVEALRRGDGWRPWMFMRLIPTGGRFTGSLTLSTRQPELAA